MFNGQVMNSYLANPLSITALDVVELKLKPTLHIEIPNVEPLSVNLINIEKINDEEMKDEYSKESKSEKIVEPKVLQNEDLTVSFDKYYLPNKLHFKKLGQTIDLKMSIVRYPTSLSESGAYIMAPRRQAVPIKLQIID